MYVATHRNANQITHILLYHKTPTNHQGSVLGWLTGTLNACTISKQEMFTLKTLSNLEKLLKLLVNVHVNAYWLYLHCVVEFCLIN